MPEAHVELLSSTLTSVGPKPAKVGRPSTLGVHGAPTAPPALPGPLVRPLQAARIEVTVKAALTVSLALVAWISMSSLGVLLEDLRRDALHERLRVPPQQEREAGEDLGHHELRRPPQADLDGGLDRGDARGPERRRVRAAGRTRDAVEELDRRAPRARGRRFGRGWRRGRGR